MFRSKKRASTPGDAVDDGFRQQALSLLDSLYGTALRLTGNRADAEDLVQETYLRAFRSASHFERGTNLKAWLFTILHNAHLNRRRHEARDTVTVDSDLVEVAPAPADTASSPEELLLRQVLDQEVQSAIDALPERYREAVWLRDVDEFSYQEIADILHVPVGTVMSRLSRGRRLLHERLIARAGQAKPLAAAGGRQ